MSLTGLIYAAIVVAWAAYLVPLWLRRHDEKTQSRSVDRFSSAMRVLGRRETSLARGRYVVRPPASLPAGAVGSVEVTAPPAADQRRASPTRRRRRVLLLLVLAAVGTAVAQVLGYLPDWAAAVPAGCVLAWLAVCRHQVRRAGSGARPGRPVRAPEVPADGQPAVVLMEPGGTTPPASAAVPAVAEPPRIAAADPSQPGGSLWDPLPVTLPTYISLPAAPRTVRTVDLTSPRRPPNGHAEPPNVEEPGGDAPAPADQPHRRAVGD